jgi:S1-C subfamily serine protease
MERMLIKHLSGSKANQVEEFAIKHHNELIFGRDTSATVKYDPDRDDLVGRQHAKISRDPNDANAFLITDLNSTNGTFVNKQRLNGTTKIQPGDSVQFGPGGPEFQFDVEPRPDNSTKATRISEVSAFGKSVPETRVINTSGASNPVPPVTTPHMIKPPGTVGKATVERMISQTATETRKSQGRKYGLIGGAAALAVLILFGVVIGGAYYYNSVHEEAIKRELADKTAESQNKSAELEKKIADDKAAAMVNPTEIVQKYGNSVVMIEVAWHLFDAQSKSQLYHQYIPNDLRVLSVICGCNLGKGVINPQAGNVIPVYVSVGNSYEPLLTTAKETNGVANAAIGSRLYGSGFFVTSDGFIMTNRHVGASWMSWYQFDSQQTPLGIVVTAEGKLASSQLVPPPTTWVPQQTKQGGKQYSGTIMGSNDSLTVTLNGKENRIKGDTIQSSDRHDVSLIKIQIPGQVTKVELNDNYDSLRKGEQVTIMGYPAASPEVVGVVKSSDPFNNESQVLQIPQVTVTTTNIGNILRGSEKDTENKTYSVMGDVIQLATNTTGGGNSGGPVFDSQGKVIGIFFASSNRAGTAITYAVPIRFGMEFLASQDSK